MSDPERNIHSFFDKLTSISDELKEIITDGSDSEIIHNILILIDELEWIIEENVSHNRDPEDGSNELFVSILAEFDILSSNFNEALKTNFKERIEGIPQQHRIVAGRAIKNLWIEKIEKAFR